jgi:3-hydroxyacyl-[acyl-carrier-protein] dehydratase
LNISSDGRLKITNGENSSGADRKRWEDLFHRVSYPFPLLMIERLEELEREKKIRTAKWVTANDFCLAGHFPGEPILPGVLTLEGLVQSAILLVAETFSRGRLRCALEKVDRVRFKRAIVPGDRVEFSVQLAAREGERWKFKGQAQVGPDTAAEANLVLHVNYREVGFEI